MDNGIFGSSVFGGELSGFGAVPFAVNQQVPSSRLVAVPTRIQPGPRPILQAPPCGPRIMANPLATPAAPTLSSGGAAGGSGPSGMPIRVQPIGPGVPLPPRLVAVPPNRLPGQQLRAAPLRVPAKPAISFMSLKKALSGLGSLLGFGAGPLATRNLSLRPTSGFGVFEAAGACGAVGCGTSGFGLLQAGQPESGRERGGIFDAAPMPTPIGDMVPWRRPQAGGVVAVPPGCQPPTLPSVRKPPQIMIPPIGPRPCWQPPAPCAPQAGAPNIVLPPPTACSQQAPRVAPAPSLTMSPPCATSGFGWWR